MYIYVYVHVYVYVHKEEPLRLIGSFMFFYLQSDNKVIVHVNNEQSRNCLSNRGLAVFAVEVAPKSMMVRIYCLAI